MVDELLLQNCQIAFTDRSFNIYCPSDLVALALKQARKDLAKWAQSFKKQCVLIFSPEFPDFPFHISAAMGDGDAEENNLIMPKTMNIDLNEAYKSDKPQYITNLKDATVLWFNPAAMAANQKSFSQLANFSALLLSDPNEITRRYERLENGETLREYEYLGYRWFFDDDSQVYLRKQMIFVGVFEPIGEFYNENCYRSTVFHAEPTGAIFR